VDENDEVARDRSLLARIRAHLPDDSKAEAEGRGVDWVVFAVVAVLAVAALAALAGCLAKRAPDAAQHIVTDQVALALVHLLEVVEVHEHDRQPPARAARALHLAPQRLVEGGVVEAASEAVGARRLGQAGLHAGVATGHRGELGEARQQLEVVVAMRPLVEEADPERAATLAVPAHRRRERAARRSAGR
jgi:hypothetical protein